MERDPSDNVTKYDCKNAPFSGNEQKFSVTQRNAIVHVVMRVSAKLELSQFDAHYLDNNALSRTELSAVQPRLRAHIRHRISTIPQ
jgi:hypothetical protein